MAYDEDLANRVRTALGRTSGHTEKAMFGGLAMLLDGNMAVVIRGKGGLMLRIDPAQQDALLSSPGAAEAVMRGRPMRGWITVAPEACASESQLRTWIDRAVTFTRTLPPKR
jgi:TfoX/Sxy family transcriptional regulator of competence genes